MELLCRNAFEQVKSVLHERYPALSISGSEHPVEGMYLHIAGLLQIVQYSAIALLFVAETQVFPRLGMAPPQWYIQLAQNKLGAAAGIWFVGNIAVANLARTGAFEVYYDGQTVFSKLASGMNPDIQMILDGLAAAMAAESL